jgi:hypothetical protein
VSDAPHDSLIRGLAGDLHPVKRLASPLRRALVWLAVVAVAAIGLALLSNLEAVAARLTAAPDMWLAVTGSVLTAIFAAVAAFELSVPDRSPRWALLPVPPLLLWIGASGLGCLRVWIIAGTHAALMSEARDCLIFILGTSIPLGLVLFLMLRRAFPLHRDLAAATAGLALAAAAASLLNFFHPFDAAATDLAVHAVAVVLVIMASRLVGRLALPPG